MAEEKQEVRMSVSHSLAPDSLGTVRLPIYVSWENLRFEVPDPQNKGEIKTILHGLNGHVKPGELVAIIGPSGSGKSSLLNCIAGRNVDGVKGDINFNGIPRPKNFARFTGYVVQDVLYFNSLTVREVLQFSANLKLPPSVPNVIKKKRVDDIINELDLSHCQDTQIGEIGKGISGGERRRLAIGLEIINEPSLLLLDEPTSGLDSASALMVGEILQRLCKKTGITILCTIHQPRYSLAKMFDKLYFLAKGREMYFGPTIPNALEFFDDCGYPCPEYDNPADFLLDLVNTSNERKAEQNATKNTETETTKEGLAKQNELQTGVASVSVGASPAPPEDEEAGGAGDDPNQSQITESRMEIVEKINAMYLKSKYREAALDFTLKDEERGDVIFATLAQNQYITGRWNQFKVILVRSFLHKFREPIALMTQVFSAVATPIIFGSVYWQINDSQQAAFDRLSAISLVFLMASFFAFDILALFPIERSIFSRESEAGMYGPLTFYLGRTLAETPQHILLLAFQAVVTYFMFGLQMDFEKICIYVLLLVLVGLAGAALLLLCSAITKTFEQANLATFIILLLMLFDGNWISLDQVPVYYKWIRYLSYIGFGVQGASVNEYRGLKIDCKPKEELAGECLFDTGEDILFLRGLDDVSISECVYWLIAMQMIYRFLAFIAFWLLFRTQKPMTVIRQTFGMKVD